MLTNGTIELDNIDTWGENIKELLLKINAKEEKFNDMNVYVVESLDAATKKLGELSKIGDVVLFENDLPDNYNEK